MHDRSVISPLKPQGTPGMGTRHEFGAGPQIGRDQTQLHGIQMKPPACIVFDLFQADVDDIHPGKPAVEGGQIQDGWLGSRNPWDKACRFGGLVGCIREVLSGRLASQPPHKPLPFLALPGASKEPETLRDFCSPLPPNGGSAET